MRQRGGISWPRGAFHNGMGVFRGQVVNFVTVQGVFEARLDILRLNGAISDGEGQF